MYIVDSHPLQLVSQALTTTLGIKLFFELNIFNLLLILLDCSIPCT